MNQQRQELKKKLESDTRLTSQHLKSLQKMRAESTDRVAMAEMRED
jgi:hypothetical protein